MTTYFCPQCKQAQPIQEYFDGTGHVARCQACGYPIEEEGVVAPPSYQAKLLFIDDDQLLLGFLREFATAHGFLPLIASDGPAGIGLARRERPDLIILDDMMPAVDGFEVCRRMRAVPELKDTPILILTVLQDPTITARGMKVGATLTMTKPLERQRLLDTITTALTLKHHLPTTS